MGANPEVKVLDAGVKVATFSVAITKKGYTKNNNDGTVTVQPDKTTWINVVAWKGLADIAERFTSKGSHVYIAGELSNRSYEKDGAKHYVTEIIADNIELLGKKPEAQQEQSAVNDTRQPDYAGSDGSDGSNDLPF